MVVILVRILGFMDGEECPSMENPIPCWGYVIFRYTMSFNRRNACLDVKLKVDDQGHDDEL
jgi:hypothetical protein